MDHQSPGRFEFADRFHGLGPLDPLLPTYRPHEFLQLQAVEAMIETLNTTAAGPFTEAPLQFLLCAGDYVDNAQWNELQWVLGLLAGATLTPNSGGSSYEGVAAVAWGDAAYWHPDQFPDSYKRRWGFPHYPGLLEAASRPFAARGARLPWLSCHGNHDAFLQGTAPANAAWNQIVTGSRKARTIPSSLSPDGYLDRPERATELLDLFIQQPEAFLTGPATTVTPDAARRVYDRREFLHAHLNASGEPRGHGFSGRNLADGIAYYVDDRRPPLRLIVLDTVNPAGNYFGSIDDAQFAWLEQRLAEVHSRYWDLQGNAVESGGADRLVVIVSHHTLATLTNDRVDKRQGNDAPRVLGSELESLLHRFPNVILWVNGHAHRNAVHPRSDPVGRTAGFWEVTTSSLLDWPCQARLVEIAANGSGTLSIRGTMVDHAAPADPAESEGVLRLAAIHRELAANDPYRGVASGRGGTLLDRNVELLIPAPFPLD